MISCLAVLAATVSLAQAHSQHPFHQPSSDPRPDVYEFEWPVKNVAIVGAGVGGLMAYRTFTECKAYDSVRIFERDDLPGGNWHYTDETPVSVPIHNGVLPDWWKSDYEPTKPPHVPFTIVHRVGSNDTSGHERLEWERRVHRAPTPVWASLEANTPSSEQLIPEFAWPPRVPWATYHWHVGRYLRSFASWLGVNSGDGSPDVSYNTRVESVQKRYNAAGKHQGWTLLLRKFTKTNEITYKETWWSEDFDAVVVATGRFQVPQVPLIPGLVNWQEHFPNQIQHARQYRRPETYAGKNVLVVGAGVARDINKAVKRAYLSVRVHFRRPLLMSRVPSNTSVISEIKTFHPVASDHGIQDGIIELLDGTNITGIDNVILGTGYRFAFPFLSQYQNSSVKGDEVPDVPEQPIVTDGTHVRSLYLGTFYIDQPTIGFMNVDLGTQPFTYGKYTAAALAKVWAGQAKLPSQEKQWEHFWEIVKSKGGFGKDYQMLSHEEIDENLRYFVGWLNGAAIHHGGSLLETPPDTREEMALWIRARYQRDPSDASLGLIDNHLLPRKELDYTRAILNDW
ncbi:hypothetical protein DL96DRAFT_1625447 [Flagelloscypha sp. PMI_526]|nr:hypothetical protein DL96DRAFT_1625447 [Flagelloscypha sp. PMI_526]